MNYSIIKEIFSGNRGNYEKLKKSKRYDEITNEIDGLIQKISESPTENGRKLLLSQLNCLQGELESEVATESYAEGFKNGLLIALETAADLKQN